MTGQDVLLHQRGRALAQRRGLDRGAARLAVRIRHPVFPYFRTSFEVSSFDCSIFCDDIMSIHHASCSGFSTGSERFGGVALTSSIGCLVNFEIDTDAFSRSSFTTAAVSAMAARNFFTTSGFFSAHSREAA